MSPNTVKVQNVAAGSIAEEAGIQAGDRIISINNEKIRDVFDYRFLTTNTDLLIEVQKQDGEIWEIEIEKDEYEDLGVEFESSLMDEARHCTNKCIFCFIDQLPKGMRDTLYFKDDDTRLSFLTGNYVTFTNMGSDELDRIIRYRMSPVNVSVHTTNPQLRIMMLNNRFAGDIFEKVKKLADAGIEVNCQIVLCRGVNDGQELDRTIGDLAGLYPGVRSISVVPVGITKHREGLFNLKPFDSTSSNEVVKQVKKKQKDILEKTGSRIVYLADEFFVMSGVNIPDYEEYEDFPQLENGVGLMASLRHQFNHILEDMGGSLGINCNRTVSIATGVSANAYIKELAMVLEKKFRGLKINVYDIKNNFFGENVTVAGLLTGQDIVDQLRGRDLGQVLLISSSMLRAGEDLFLDDFTVKMVESKLGINVISVENNGRDFVFKVLGRGEING